MRRGLWLAAALALCACKGGAPQDPAGIEPMKEENPFKAAPPKEAKPRVMTAADCRAVEPCPDGCYKGPSSCSKGQCTEDEFCAEPGYKPEVSAGGDSLSLMRPVDEEADPTAVTPGAPPKLRRGAPASSGLDMISEGGEKDESVIGVKPPPEE